MLRKANLFVSLTLKSFCPDRNRFMSGFRIVVLLSRKCSSGRDYPVFSIPERPAEKIQISVCKYFDSNRDPLNFLNLNSTPTLSDFHAFQNSFSSSNFLEEIFHTKVPEYHQRQFQVIVKKFSKIFENLFLKNGIL